MEFEFKQTALPGVIQITPKTFRDDRGFLSEVYDSEQFVKNGINANFIREFVSFSKKNVIRGLHLQMPPFQQSKLVRCTKGRIFDVVVDARKDSPTFGRHASFMLSEENNLMIFIPKGFAHGFIALTDATISYKVDNTYSPKHESGIVWNDKDINIPWPLESNPILSEKDKALPTLKEFRKNG